MFIEYPIATTSCKVGRDPYLDLHPNGTKAKYGVLSSAPKELYGEFYNYIDTPNAQLTP